MILRPPHPRGEPAFIGNPLVLLAALRVDCELVKNSMLVGGIDTDTEIRIGYYDIVFIAQKTFFKIICRLGSGKIKAEHEVFPVEKNPDLGVNRIQAGIRYPVELFYQTGIFPAVIAEIAVHNDFLTYCGNFENSLVCRVRPGKAF